MHFEEATSGRREGDEVCDDSCLAEGAAKTIPAGTIL
jgi:hypothetical protein